MCSIDEGQDDAVHQGKDAKDGTDGTGPRKSKLEATRGVTLRLTALPILEKLMVMAKANSSSLPMNHLAVYAL